MKSSKAGNHNQLIAENAMTKASNFGVRARKIQREICLSKSSANFTPAKIQGGLISKLKLFVNLEKRKELKKEQQKKEQISRIPQDSLLQKEDSLRKNLITFPNEGKEPQEYRMTYRRHSTHSINRKISKLDLESSSKKDGFIQRLFENRTIEPNSFHSISDTLEKLALRRRFSIFESNMEKEHANKFSFNDNDFDDSLKFFYNFDENERLCEEKYLEESLPDILKDDFELVDGLIQFVERPIRAKSFVCSKKESVQFCFKSS